jgi:hypothetical protein
MKAGDIVFTHPQDRMGTASVALQWGKLAFGNWSHAAVSVLGPLMIEAFKPDGIKLSIWAQEARSLQLFQAFRYKGSIDQTAFQDACLYFLDQTYSLRARAPGQSFCSYLVQQIFRRMDVPPFNRVQRPLPPNRLYSLLKRSHHWQRLLVPAHSFEGSKTADTMTLRFVNREISGVCNLLRSTMLQRLTLANRSKEMATLVDGTLASMDAIDAFVLSDAFSAEQKTHILESYLSGRPPAPGPNFLAYRWFEIGTVGQDDASIATLNSIVKQNWQHEEFNAADLTALRSERIARKYRDFIDLEGKLNEVLEGTIRDLVDFMKERGDLASDHRWLRANLRVALLIATLKRGEAVSNERLGYIVSELRRDALAYRERGDRPELVTMIERREMLLATIQRFVLSTAVEINDPFWDELYGKFTRGEFLEGAKTSSTEQL